MPEPISGDVVDDDTLQAVIALWRAAGGQSLPALVTQKPKWGRGKSPDPIPYAHVEVEFVGRLPAGAAAGQPVPWYDDRKVTLRVWALKDDAVTVQGLLVGIFNLQTTLVFPSKAGFMRLWPDGGATLSQDKDTKDGRDVWVCQLVFTVRSVRLQ